MLFCLLFTVTLSRPIAAQTQTLVGATPATSPTPAPAEPSPTREVIASGSAAVGPGGVAAARKAAIAQALRSAIEQATGVYVSASTLTRNYQLLRDQVITHADGFATTEAVLKEVDGAKEVRVTVKARVSLRPLAQQLKALNLTRVWRVHVTDHPHGFGTNASEKSVVLALEKALGDAGLTVVSSADAADIDVDLNQSFATIPSRETDGAGSFVMREVGRGELDVRATLIQTGEVVAALKANVTSEKVRPGISHPAIVDALTADLTPRLVNALIVVPSRNEWTVQLEVGHIGTVSRADQFQKALATLPEITGVTRRRYENGNGIWDLKIFSDNESETALDLEQNAALKPYHLKVLTDSLVRIVAATDGVAPVFKTLALAAPDLPPVSYYHPPIYPSRPASASMPLYPTRSASAPLPNIYGPSVGRTDKSVAPLGSLVIADDLQYEAGGGLTGRNGGEGWDASWIRHGWASASQVMAGGLVYPNLSASKTLFRTGTGNQGDDRWFVHPLGTPGEVIYLSQTLRGLPNSPNAWDRSGFGYRVDDGDNNSMTGVAFGKFEWDPHLIIRAAPAHEFAPTSIVAQQNTTYFLVARITFGATDSRVDLWVDPVPGRPLPANPDATMTLRFNRISRYSALSEIPCDFGPIRIGSTYASVAPKQPSVASK